MLISPLRRHQDIKMYPIASIGQLNAFLLPFHRCQVLSTYQWNQISKTALHFVPLIPNSVTASPRKNGQFSLHLINWLDVKKFGYNEQPVITSSFFYIFLLIVFSYFYVSVRVWPFSWMALSMNMNAREWVQKRRESVRPWSEFFNFGKYRVYVRLFSPLNFCLSLLNLLLRYILA